MALTFYYGSGSPFAWKVWLALEYKQIPYEFKLMSFQGGDLKTPEFLAINPRHKVPAIVDHDYAANFALFESSAIIEYLEDKFKDGPSLWPKDVQKRALARRIAAEADTYFQPAYGPLIRLTVMRAKDDADANELKEVQDKLIAELNYFENLLSGDFFAGELSVADFAIYPMLAATRRVDQKLPHRGVGAHFGPKIKAFMQRIESLPYLEKTIPPHWKG
jgi:glutathione S-transferase